MANKKIMNNCRLGTWKLICVSYLMEQELWRVAQVRVLVGKKLITKEGIGRNKLLRKGEETGNRVHSIRREMEGQSVIGRRNLPEI